MTTSMADMGSCIECGIGKKGKSKMAHLRASRRVNKVQETAHKVERKAVKVLDRYRNGPR